MKNVMREEGNLFFTDGVVEKAGSLSYLLLPRRRTSGQALYLILYIQGWVKVKIAREVLSRELNPTFTLLGHIVIKARKYQLSEVGP
jgi:hypothetical protein